MTKKIRALLAATVALAAFSTVSSTASALDAEPAGPITMASLGGLVFDSIIDMDCNVTLTGELSATAENRADTAVGSISLANIQGCDGMGEAEVLVEEGNPLAIKLGAEWAGPSNRMSLYLEEFTFAMNDIIFVGDCLYQGDIYGTVTTDAEGNTGLWTSSQTAVPFVDGEDDCWSVLRAVGTFSLTPQDLDL